MSFKENVENGEAEQEKTAADPGDAEIEQEVAEESQNQQDQAARHPDEETAEKKIDELNNKLLRLQADFDNFRRRTRQEKEEFFKYANQDLISAMLPVLDNFQRAIAANDKEDDPFCAGVKMIYKQVIEVLAKEGLTQIEAIGNEFNPNLHEAVMSEETEEHGANIIVEEFQKGYKLKEKVIRPSMVKVANAK